MLEDLTELDRDVAHKLSRPALLSTRLASAQSLIVLSGHGRGSEGDISAGGWPGRAHAAAPSQLTPHAAGATARPAVPRSGPLGTICQASDCRLDEHARILGAAPLAEAGLLAPPPGAPVVVVPVTSSQNCVEMVTALAGERWVSLIPIFQDGGASSGGVGGERAGSSGGASGPSWVHGSACDWGSAELAALVLCGGAGTRCYVLCPPLDPLLPQLATLFSSSTPIKVTHDCRRMAAALPLALLPPGPGHQTSGGPGLGAGPVAAPFLDTQAAFGALVWHTAHDAVSPTPPSQQRLAPELPPAPSASGHARQYPAAAAAAPSLLCAPPLPLPPRPNGEVLPLRLLLRKFLPSLCEAVLGVSEDEEAPAALPADVLSHLCPSAAFSATTSASSSPLPAAVPTATINTAVAEAVQLAPLLVRLGGRLWVEGQLEDVKRTRADAMRSRRAAWAQGSGGGGAGGGGGGDGGGEGAGGGHDEGGSVGGDTVDGGDAWCGVASNDAMDTSGAPSKPGGGCSAGADDARLLQRGMLDASVRYWRAAANLFSSADPPADPARREEVGSRTLPPPPTPPPMHALARAVVSNVSRHGIQVYIPCAEGTPSADVAPSPESTGRCAASAQGQAARTARAALITPAEWFGPALPPPTDATGGAASPSAAHPPALFSPSPSPLPPPSIFSPTQSWPRVGKVITVRIVCSHHAVEGVSLPLASPHLQPLNSPAATELESPTAGKPLLPQPHPPHLFSATSLLRSPPPAAPSTGSSLWGRVYHVAPRRALLSVEHRYLARLGHADVRLRETEDPEDHPAVTVETALPAAAGAEVGDVPMAEGLDASMDVSESEATSAIAPAAHGAAPNARITSPAPAGVGPHAAAPRDLTKHLTPGDLIRVTILAMEGEADGACGDAAPGSTSRLAVAAVLPRCAPAARRQSHAGGTASRSSFGGGRLAAGVAGRDGCGHRTQGGVGEGGGEGDGEFEQDEERDIEGGAGHKRSWESDSEAEEGEGGSSGTGGASGAAGGCGEWMGDEDDDALAPSKRRRAQ